MRESSQNLDSIPFGILISVFFFVLGLMLKQLHVLCSMSWGNSELWIRIVKLYKFLLSVVIAIALQFCVIGAKMLIAIVV